MEEERLRAILESLLFVAGEPITMARLQAVLESVPRDEIRKALADLSLTYANGSRGIVLEEVAGGYQLRTPREHAYYVRKLLAAKPPRLSRPLLETVAIIAYRQPVTRPEIEQLRGVDSGGVLETLIERGLIRIAGRKEAPGRPIVYATTPEFLEVFSLKDLASLPDLDEFRALQTVGEIAESEELAVDDPTVRAPDESAGSESPEPQPAAGDDSVSAPASEDQPVFPDRSDDNSSRD
ncbi:MAG TPA: SMC-Scp complex subunit ScpB [Candidatus Binataceae bacterium]|nr:SMC-Scp complex subunit ScpB [Candidatus Binataceae bacterium]